jgi:hypothetical protein
MIVSLEDGSTIGTIRAAQGVVESLHDRIAFVDQPRLAVVTVPSMTRLFQFERTTFGVLAATFSHDALVVSESGGPVRCLEVPSGRLRWQFQPDAGSHCLDVTYAASQDAFYAVVWSYQEGGDKHLVRLEPSRGDAVRVKSLGCPAETCFWPSRSCLVTSLGAIVYLATL